MILIYGVAILFLVLTVRAFGWEYFDGFFSFLADTFITFVLTIVGAGIGMIIALIIGTQIEQYEQSTTLNLVSLRNNDGISGSFFLGTGTIGTSNYYLYNSGTEDAFKPGKVEAEGNITVFQEKRTNGTLTIFVHAFKNQSAYWYADHLGNPRYEFHIPKGSLKSGFALN
ncbi:MAG: hypothetical protein WCW78_04070 [Candidatus Paceibacterota bacterium]|jgi:hypothetical protein